MRFTFLYIIIPTLLFILGAKKGKKNWILALYLLIITLLSYDNVTDFGFYFDEFQYYLQDSVSEESSGKGREWGWVALLRFFSFTKYGITIVHSAILLLTTFTFIKFSRQIGLMSISIWLYFILDLTTLHDNILRQDISIICAFYAYFEILKENTQWSFKRYAKLVLLVFVAVSFHFSAIILIPFFFFIMQMAKVRLNFWIVFVLALLCGFVSYTGIVDRTLGVFFFLLDAQTGYGNYYIDFISNYEINKNGLFCIVMCIISVTPLFYFTHINKRGYETNRLLRLSVNLSWIVMTWKILFVSITVLTRIVDYLIWFEVWGFASMIFNAFTIKRRFFIQRLITLCMIGVLYFNTYRIITGYYGKNAYLTIFSDESKEMKVFDSNQTEIGEKRIR